MKSTLRFSSLVLAALLGGHAQAQVSEDFEGLAAGSLNGQNGWTQTSGGANSIVVDNDRFSPRNGSSQSIRFTSENGAFAGIEKFLGAPVASGRRVAEWDVYAAPRTSSNQVFLVGFDRVGLPGGDASVFAPYHQNGGTPKWALNGLLDPDGLGPQGYGFNGMLPDQVGAPSQWYHVEMTLDFDGHFMEDVSVSGIDAGGGLTFLEGDSTTRFYFNNDGATFVDAWNRFGMLLFPATPEEQWNFDNFRVTPVPEPASAAALALGLGAFLRRRKS